MKLMFILFIAFLSLSPLESFTFAAPPERSTADASVAPSKAHRFEGGVDTQLGHSFGQEALTCCSHASGRRSQTFQKIHEGLYVAQREGDLPYFVLERVTQDSFRNWDLYAEMQEEAYSRIVHLLFSSRMRFHDLSDLQNRQREQAEKKFGKVREWIRQAADPISKFKSCLKFYKKSEVWVAYAIRKRPDQEFNPLDTSKVEMAVAVLTSEEAPFVLHMGISRGLMHLETGEEATPGLSIKLHAFAGQVMRKIDPSKKYLITTPLLKMRELIEKALPRHAYQIGHNFEGSLIQTYGGDSVYDPGFHFEIKNQKGEVEFATEGEAASQYGWFFSNTQPSLSYPYLTVKLEELEVLF